MRTRHQATAARMDASPEELALEQLRKEMSDTGHQWISSSKPIMGAVHAVRGPYLYCSDHGGKAEAFLAAWCRGKLTRSVRAIPLQPQHGLSDSQAAAARIVLSSPVACLSGGPGTGKTYTSREICRAFLAAGLSVVGCAFTGAAASRLQELTGIPCLTIHRMLGARPNNTPSLDGEESIFTVKKLGHHVVVVDESSMISSGLLLSLASRLADYSRLILIGDPHQLPPVEPGAVFRELCRYLPHAHLTEIRRTDADSPIGHAAAQVLRGEMPHTVHERGNGFALIRLLAHRIGIDGTRPDNHPLSLAEHLTRFEEPGERYIYRVRCMASRNVTVSAYNAEFTKWRCNQDSPIPYICLKNTEVGDGAYVFNGDIGIHVWSNVHHHCIDFPGIGEVELARSSAREAWFTTVNKAQGREANSALMVVEGCSSRSAIYTAITRAKKRFLLVGLPKTIESCIFREETPRFSLFGAFWNNEAELIESEESK